MGVWKVLCCAVALATASPLWSADIAGPIRVVDGDTLVVQDMRIRLHGIDAPEREQTCTSPEGTVWACGSWVTEQVRARYERRVARCEALELDRYGRTVARCRVEGEDMARALVQEGWAFAYRRYSLDYDLDEKRAAVRGAGLHGSEVQAPAAYRAERSSTRSVPAEACRIKGNISSKGTRIYHVPGQRDYEGTRISASRGERWFCSRAEAEAAGWRAARR
jgi:endonuclease YncB( thermonuclease family)